jgi:hypothetical protein
MSRKRVSKGQIILKKDEKFADVIEKLPQGYAEDDFIESFINMYPEDWKRINKRYQEHIKLNNGKPFPMPCPRKYLRESLKAYLKRLAKPS